MSDDIELTKKESFNFWTKEIFRFADMDALRHLNNIASAVYCETARAHLLSEKFGHDFAAQINWLTVNVNITYLKPVDYPNDIDIGTRVKRIGNSSIVLQQGLFDSEGCFSTGETVLVNANLTTGKAVPLTTEMKTIFGGYLC